MRWETISVLVPLIRVPKRLMTGRLSNWLTFSAQHIKSWIRGILWVGMSCPPICLCLSVAPVLLQRCFLFLFVGCAPCATFPLPFHMLGRLGFWSEGLRCHTKTMMNMESCEAQTWTLIMSHLDKWYTQKMYFIWWNLECWRNTSTRLS
jgi:hypothetical protein